MALRYNRGMSGTRVSREDVVKIASLANLELSDKEFKRFPEQFSETIDVVNQLGEIDTKGVELTTQVTDLKNVLRTDEVLGIRGLSKEEALSQARRVSNGYFVVDKILDKE